MVGFSPSFQLALTRSLALCLQQGSLQQAQPYGQQFYNMQGAYWNGGGYPNTYSTTVGAAAAQQQYLQAGNMGQWQPTYPANYQPYGYVVAYTATGWGRWEVLGTDS